MNRDQTDLEICYIRFLNYWLCKIFHKHKSLGRKTNAIHFELIMGGNNLIERSNQKKNK